MKPRERRFAMDDLVDPQEIAALGRAFGPFPRQHYGLRVRSAYLESWAGKILHDRRGEVVLVVQCATGEVLLHTKVFYPPGIYRLPSGGVSWGEAVSDALDREVYEETGFTSPDKQLLGLVTYDFQDDDWSVPFVSYVFLLTGIEGQPAVHDEGERISDFRWMPVSELSAVAATLRALPEDLSGRRDWGRFRALVHEFVALFVV
jgi:ADP-ribose pyrophosphatase YjhB (NUDIX family)